MKHIVFQKILTGFLAGFICLWHMPASGLRTVAVSQSANSVDELQAALGVQAVSRAGGLEEVNAEAAIERFRTAVGTTLGVSSPRATIKLVGFPPELLEHREKVARGDEFVSNGPLDAVATTLTGFLSLSAEDDRFSWSGFAKRPGRKVAATLTYHPGASQSNAYILDVRAFLAQVDGLSDLQTANAGASVELSEEAMRRALQRDEASVDEADPARQKMVLALMQARFVDWTSMLAEIQRVAAQFGWQGLLTTGQIELIRLVAEGAGVEGADVGNDDPLAIEEFPETDPGQEEAGLEQAPPVLTTPGIQAVLPPTAGIEPAPRSIFVPDAYSGTSVEIPPTGLLVDGFSLPNGGIVPDALIDAGLVEPGATRLLVPSAVMDGSQHVYIQAGLLDSNLVTTLQAQGVAVTEFLLSDIPEPDTTASNIFIAAVPHDSANEARMASYGPLVNLFGSSPELRPTSVSGLATLIQAAWERGTLRVNAIFSDDVSGIIAIDLYA